MTFVPSACAQTSLISNGFGELHPNINKTAAIVKNLIVFIFSPISPNLTESETDFLFSELDLPSLFLPQLSTADRKKAN